MERYCTCVLAHVHMCKLGRNTTPPKRRIGNYVLRVRICNQENLHELLMKFMLALRVETQKHGRVYFASISDIQLDVSPSKKFWMQNRTKAWGLYYFPSSWMYPLDVQNGCALEHSLKVNSVSHPMKTSHPTKKTQVHWTQKNVPHLG